MRGVVCAVCCVMLCHTARVHPGETNSAFMMKGALQQLLADTEEGAQLREAFVFKVSAVLCCAVQDSRFAGTLRA